MNLSVLWRVVAWVKVHYCHSVWENKNVKKGNGLRDTVVIMQYFYICIINTLSIFYFKILQVSSTPLGHIYFHSTPFLNLSQT